MSDQTARDRIAEDLGANFLVEAGAGSGKTTALVARLVMHVRRGTPLESLAAVTFTRKAANELHERFQNGLEEAARSLPAGEERRRIETALEDLDRGFIGTIHAFCARLLRDRPIEAGLDPNFHELDEREWPLLVEDFWREWHDHCRLRDDRGLRALLELGIEPRSLLESFRAVVDNPDVAFEAPARPLPAHAECRARLERLLDQADSLMPDEEPETGWDELQARIRYLRFLREVSDWSVPAAFFTALTALTDRGRKVTQNRWGEDRATKAAAKALGEAVEAFVAAMGAPLVIEWREHRYRPVQEFLARAAHAFEERRAVSGHLGFQDLLTRARNLLRDHAGARAALGARYRHLLVDEFQDTDPLQAEVCFLLASDPSEGSDWRTVRPCPGSLFVVGDPKQSIYRFRRADIQTYELVKRRIRASGEVLHLTRNFRSTTAIAEFVNRHFQGVFPKTASAVQAAFSPLDCHKEPEAGEGVHRIRCFARNNKSEIPRADAANIASWIAARIANGAAAGDFMVLTYQTHGITEIARALAERHVAVQTTGASLPQETELRELVLVLKALADPENPVLVAAVLEGIFFGLTPADLYEARRAGQAFVLTREPEGDGPVAMALARLNAWRNFARQNPPDVLLDRLVEETGLLAWSVSQPLGDARAGALLRLGDLLRQDAGPPVFDLPSAILRLESVLVGASDDAPLRPGRGNAVQVLNLHKAKGLEAKVVILANPVSPVSYPPTLHVRRGDDGRAVGGIVVKDDRDVLAQPPGWEEQATAETRFLDAERERLLYVAATRAKRQLVVSEYGGPEEPPDPERYDKSGWRSLQASIGTDATLEVTVTPAIGRETLADAGEELDRAIRQAEEWRAEAGRAGWRRTTVTRSAREDAEEEKAGERTRSSTEAGGKAWGRAVHRALEGAGRGREGARLESFIRAVAHDEDLGPAEGDRLLATVRAFLASPEWQAVSQSGARFEYPVARLIEGEDGPVLEEGVIDAVVFGDREARIFDWKTGGPEVTRDPAYQRQVKTYEEIVAALTGQPAKGEVVPVSPNARR